MTTQSARDAEVDRKLAELERQVAVERRGTASLARRRGELAAGTIVTRYPSDEGEGLGWRFLIGVVLMLFGAWAVLGNVIVTSGFFGGLFGFGFFGMTGGGFGWTLLPIVLGIALVVARPGLTSKVGWVLVLAGIAFIFAEVLSSMHIMFRPVALPALLMMFAPIGLGLGLVLSDLMRVRS
jgi:hypothetical protein